MHQRTFIKVMLFCYILIAGNRAFSHSAEPDTLHPKNVLILFSLEPVLPAYEDITENIKKKVRQEFSQPVNFYMDYVELSRFSNADHLSTFFDYYSKKYSGSKFDLFISIGPGLMPLVERFGSPMLDSIPKLFAEINVPSMNRNYSIKKKNETGVFIDLNPEDQISYALKLLPDTKNIFVITGISELELKIFEAYDFALKNFRGKYNITYYNGIIIPTLIKKMKNLPEKSIVFLPSYQKDSSGTTFYSREIIQYLSGFTNTPIFHLFDSDIRGKLGGLIISTNDLGAKIGEVSLRILNGENPDNIESYHSNFSKYMFDWKQLKKWNIDDKTLPEGSIIVNKEQTFVEQYYYYIIAGIIFFLVETNLVTILFYLYNKQRKQTLEIKEKEERFRTLVDYNRLTELSGLTASLSHELNQPLAAILSCAQAAQRFLKNDKFDAPLFDEILVNIIEDVRRASGIMHSLRSMIKKENRDKKPLNLNETANEVYQLFVGQAVINDINVLTDYDEAEPFVTGDSILIQQVILNLLLNASEALEKDIGNGKEIILKTRVHDGHAVLSVTDTGPGVSDNLRDTIFKPFFSTKYSGLGIGLSICRNIIESHDGRLYIGKNKPKGSVFSFKLKVTQ